jgi:hypothetical protein
MFRDRIRFENTHQVITHHHIDDTSKETPEEVDYIMRKESEESAPFIREPDQLRPRKMEEEKEQNTTNMTYLESDSSILEIKNGIERLRKDQRYPLLDDLLKI